MSCEERVKISACRSYSSQISGIMGNIGNDLQGEFRRQKYESCLLVLCRRHDYWMGRLIKLMYGLGYVDKDERGSVQSID
jgi:hypothetical protein